jgi:hypothetical protein
VREPDRPHQLSKLVAAQRADSRQSECDCEKIARALVQLQRIVKQDERKKPRPRQRRQRRALHRPVQQQKTAKPRFTVLEQFAVPPIVRNEEAHVMEHVAPLEYIGADEQSVAHEEAAQKNVRCRGPSHPFHSVRALHAAATPWPRPATRGWRFATRGCPSCLVIRVTKLAVFGGVRLWRIG